MSAALVDLSGEWNALRRVSLLMERLRLDGKSDPELSTLRSEVDVLRRAAASGEAVRRTSVLQLEKSIAKHAIPSETSRASASTAELLRSSIFMEMNEILHRLTGSSIPRVVRRSAMFPK